MENSCNCLNFNHCIECFTNSFGSPIGNDCRFCNLVVILRKDLYKIEENLDLFNPCDHYKNNNNTSIEINNSQNNIHISTNINQTTETSINNNYNIQNSSIDMMMNQNLINNNIFVRILDDPEIYPHPRSQTPHHIIMPYLTAEIKNPEYSHRVDIEVIESDHFHSPSGYLENLVMGETIVQFKKLRVDRKIGSSNISSFTLKLTFKSQPGGKIVGEVLSNPIRFYNHTKDLPVPQITKIIPSYISLVDPIPPSITLFSNYFKFGSTSLVNVFFTNAQGFVVLVIGQDQMEHSKVRSHYLSFPTPTNLLAGSYNIFARYIHKKQSLPTNITDSLEQTITFVDYSLVHPNNNNNNPLLLMGNFYDNYIQGNN